MNGQMKTVKRNAALVELVLVILFFALSSMVLVQVFVKARIMSRTSQAETLGLVLAQDLIEQWKAEPACMELLFSAESGWREITGSKSSPDVAVGKNGSAEESEFTDAWDSAGEVRIFQADCGQDMRILINEGQEAEAVGRSAGEDSGAGQGAEYRICAELAGEALDSGRLYRIRITILRIHDGESVADLSTAHYVSGEEATP